MAANKRTTRTTASPAKTADKVKLAPATEAAASGALVEPKIIADIDTAHPAVDDNPRANTTADQNRIDFNDPTKEEAEAVADNLKKAG